MSARNYFSGERSVAPLVTGGGAKQSFKDECDINTIMRRYVTTGVPPPVKGRGIFGDFSGAGDFQSAVNRLKDAEVRFMALPSAVRDRFGNSVAKLLAFVSDKANKEEAIKLGLIAAPTKEPPKAAPISDKPAGT